MNALMSPDLSVAFMHHHGDYDTQYLSAWPKPSTAEEARDYLLHCYRTSLNRARHFGYDTDSIRRNLQSRDQLPDAWMAELDDSALAKDDSLESAMTNIVLSDFARYAFRPNCRVAFWNACYNGSWHRENCIANEYIFSTGKDNLRIGRFCQRTSGQMAGPLCRSVGTGCYDRIPEPTQSRFGNARGRRPDFCIPSGTRSLS